MSIYIEDMDKPTNCYDCPLVFSCKKIKQEFGNIFDSDDLLDIDLDKNVLSGCPIEDGAEYVNIYDPWLVLKN